MSYFKNDGIQVQEYVYDFAVDGGLVSTIDLSAKAGYSPLPDNAIVLEVHARVITAFVGTSTTLAWGNTTDPDGYSPAVAEATLVADFVASGAQQDSVLLWDATNDHLIPFLANAADDRDFSVSIATAALTAGKIIFSVSFMQDSLA